MDGVSCQYHLCGALARDLSIACVYVVRWRIHDTSSFASTYLGSTFVIDLTLRYGFQIKKLCIPTFQVPDRTQKKTGNGWVLMGKYKKNTGGWVWVRKSLLIPGNQAIFRVMGNGYD